MHRALLKCSRRAVSSDVLARLGELKGGHVNLGLGEMNIQRDCKPTVSNIKRDFCKLIFTPIQM